MIVLTTHFVCIFFYDIIRVFIIQFFKLYFIDYGITVVPVFPPIPPSTQHPPSLRQSPHRCSCPWVMHVSSLAAPFPVPYFAFPWLFCNCLLYLLIPSPVHLFSHIPLGGKKRKGCQGTRIKDSWTKPKEGRIEGGRGGAGESGGRKMGTTVLE